MNSTRSLFRPYEEHYLRTISSFYTDMWYGVYTITYKEFKTLKDKYVVYEESLNGKPYYTTDYIAWYKLEDNLNILLV